MRRRVLVTGLVLLVCLVTPYPARAASITFAQSVQLGPNQTLTLNIELLDVVDLVTFGFDIAFDPTILGSPVVTRGSVFTNAAGFCELCFFPG